MKTPQDRYEIGEMYEQYGVLLAPSKHWEKDNYGFWPEGMGDCISRTMGEARRNKDTQHIEKCADLLIQRKRWPDEIQEENREFIANNTPQQWLSRWMYKLGWREHTLYRPQSQMSRDPFIHLWSACYVTGLTQFISCVKAPFWLYRPHIWAWRRYLITGKRKRWYLLLERIAGWFPAPEYAREQAEIRVDVITVLNN